MNFHLLEAIHLPRLLAPAQPLSDLLTRYQHSTTSRQVSPEMQSYVGSEERCSAESRLGTCVAGGPESRQVVSRGGTQVSAWLHSTNLWKSAKSGLARTHPLPSFETQSTALCLVTPNEH